MKNQMGFEEDDDPQLMDTLTPGTSTQQAPVAVQPPPPPPAAAPQPAPAAAMNQPPPVAAPAKPSPQLPGMPPGITPDQLAGYLNQQKGSIDQYGPQAQMQLQQSLNDRRNSLGYKISDAGKGFADALMQGVARAGNPGWQNQFEGQENQYGADQMNALRGAHEGSIKNVEAKMSLDKMNPNSVLSKTAQQNYAPLFQELGYPANKIQGMSAANIDSALNLMTQYGGKKMEARIKEYDLEIEKMRTMGTLSHQGAEERMAKEKNQQEALSEYSKMPWYSRMMHPDISKSLEQHAGMDDEDITPDVKAYADKHGLTAEQALAVKKARGG